jgi:amino acid transporter
LNLFPRASARPTSISSTFPSAPAPVSAKLKLLSLIATTFFMVSGGPYGIEEIVQKAGYSRSLLILIVTPLIWSIPVAMLVGELSAALPEEGGYYAWVARALGPFWGFQEAWLSLAASIFDMSIYPTLFVLYLGEMWPAVRHGHNGVLVGAAVIAVCTLWNIAGVRAVGTGSVLLMTALLSPFAVLVVLAFMRASNAAAMPVHTVSFDLMGGILIAMWNYMGWDNASTVAGEVDNPQRTYPLAMLGAVTLVAGSYLVTVAAVRLAGIDATSWITGSWADVGRVLGGPALGIAIVAGGMVCGLGMLNALVLSYSRVPYAMAEHGHLPRVFTLKTRRTGAPWFSIIVCALAWAACLGLGFERLVQLDIMLYGLSLLLEFVALVALRIREPNLPRPFRVAGGVPAIVALTAGPAFVLALALVRGGEEHAGAINPLLLGLVLVAAGVGVYFVARLRRSWRELPAQ